MRWAAALVSAPVSLFLTRERVRRRDRERHDLAMRGLDVVLWDWNMRTGEAYLSPGWKGMLGYADHELPNRFEEWEGRGHPDDALRVRETLQSYLEGRVAHYEVEHRLLHKDGSYRWVLSRGACLRDEAGRPYRMSGSHADVTGRKEAGERLARLASFPELNPNPVAEVDPAGGVLYANPAADRLFPDLRATGPDHPLFGGLKAAGEDFSDEVEVAGAFYHRNVSYVSGLVRVYAMDITRRKETEKELTRSESGLAEAQRITRLGNWDYDIRGDVAVWSDELYRICGLSPQSFVPSYEAFLAMVHPEDRPLLRRAVRRALLGRKGSSIDYRVVRPNGEVRAVHTRYEVLEDADGRPSRLLGTVHDVTERRALEEQLQHQAFHDPLTGLPNRALFLDRLSHALQRSHQHGEVAPVAVLFMDLDNFKVVNDSLGHEAGDQLLVGVAERLLGCLGAGDTAARLGGDEFTVLLEDADGVGGAVRVAGRVARALRAPFVLEGHEVFVSASCGISAGGDGGRCGAGDLLRDADVAMYVAKRKGKDRCEVFDPSMDAAARDRLRLENDLRRALENGEFRVHYQPKVSLKTARVVGVEALLRWEHPQRGLVPPLEFIPVAEESGLIFALGRWVLREACRQAREWTEDLRHLPEASGYAGSLGVSVNLSARQFQEPDLARDVRDILQETGLDAGCLILEITESVVMEDAPLAAGIMRELKSLGVRLSIDDFGTGYSSLAYLKRFPADYLKIDRAFVDGLGRDPESTAIVSAMVNLSHDLGLMVIAEGVETQDQQKRLQALGCELAQGYHFARPLDPAAASEYLAIRPKNAAR